MTQQQEIYQNMTKGEWFERGGNLLVMHVKAGVKLIAKFYTKDAIQVKVVANAAAIVSAVNNTYGKGINPEGVEGLIRAVKSARRAFLKIESFDASMLYDIIEDMEKALAAANLT